MKQDGAAGSRNVSEPGGRECGAPPAPKLNDDGPWGAALRRRPRLSLFHRKGVEIDWNLEKRIFAARMEPGNYRFSFPGRKNYLRAFAFFKKAGNAKQAIFKYYLLCP